MSKIWGYIVAFFAGIGAILAILYKREDKPIEPKFDALTEPVKEEIKVIEKKEDDLKKDGVADKTKDEELEYWKNN